MLFALYSLSSYFSLFFAFLNLLFIFVTLGYSTQFLLFAASKNIKVAINQVIAILTLHILRDVIYVAFEKYIC